MKRQPADPAERMTLKEAQAIAEQLRRDMHSDSDALARFCLLLRCLTYHADEAAREDLYIAAEANCAPYIDGTDEAIREQMQRQLDALRKEKAK